MASPMARIGRPVETERGDGTTESGALVAADRARPRSSPCCRRRSNRSRPAAHRICDRRAQARARSSPRTRPSRSASAAANSWRTESGTAGARWCTVPVATSTSTAPCSHTAMVVDGSTSGMISTRSRPRTAADDDHDVPVATRGLDRGDRLGVDGSPSNSVPSTSRAMIVGPGAVIPTPWPRRWSASTGSSRSRRR